MPQQMDGPCTLQGWSLCGPELGKCPRKALHVPGVQQMLNKCSHFPKVLYAQLVDEVTTEFPNAGSGWDRTGREVQRPTGRMVSVMLTPLCHCPSEGSHRQPVDK